MRDVVILGSTGSIGTQALDVIASRREEFAVVALTAGGSQLDLLAEQVRAFAPRFVAVPDAAVEPLRAKLAGVDVEIAGDGGNETAARLPCDVVLNAITGAAGLMATLATLEAGTMLALANKESLVIGGRLVTDAAAPGQLVAVDSEHSAFAQALRAGKASEVRRLILTASGGPFRGRGRDQLTDVTPAQAMAHPTWNMGRVITINSATLVNKGLELIEAALLYGIDYDAITVVVHPTSDIHSMVEYVDGATIAQASPPDMRLPIALGLAWPDRIPDAAASYDWTIPRTWTFEPLDDEAFGAVELARRAGKAAGTAPAVYNAANEVCVDAFCAGELGFLGIVDTVGAVLDEHLTDGHVADAALSLDAVLAADAWARRRAEEICSRGAAS
ncbi:MAG: 1-deoxy-D-xylulose-5-phosphate reductoisomerase [Propionibacteriaceae bacterium]|nr:1-deoxy-D-xylulose-5-phosphate reductoisomerase [Propionibacteriaceae bacterium]